MYKKESQLKGQTICIPFMSHPINHKNYGDGKKSGIRSPAT